MDYLLKTEPSTYSFVDLQREKTTTWDGVSNPVALKHLRGMKAGDRLVVTLDLGGATEIRTFDAHTLKPAGRLTFVGEP